jgi:hypothetical protein
MTSLPPKSIFPQLRLNRRHQIQCYLAISAFIAAHLVTGCSSDEPVEVSPIDTRPPVPALFYETTAQCEADAKRQQATYEAQLTAASAQPSPTILEKTAPLHPKPPALKPGDCAAQMQAAQAEHDRHAPVYQNLSDCQDEGVQCEYYDGASGSGGYHSSTYIYSGYRPRFGGTYIYYQGNPADVVNPNTIRTGTGQTIYRPHTVYASATPGEVVTPQGEMVATRKLGRVAAPGDLGMAAPSRPQGHAAQGTISGRNRSGFGSTFKGTGRGGK